MPTKTLAIFDFDGTIAKLIVDWRGLKKTLEKEFNINFNSNSFVNILSKYRQRNPEIYYKKIQPIIHNFEITNLDQLKFNQHILAIYQTYPKIGIFSNNLHQTIVSAFKKLPKKFKQPDIIVGFDDVKIPKPDPEGIYHILNQLNYNVDDVIYYGDQESDIEVCQKAKININFVKGQKWIQIK